MPGPKTHTETSLPSPLFQAPFIQVTGIRARQRRTELLRHLRAIAGQLDGVHQARAAVLEERRQPERRQLGKARCTEAEAETEARCALVFFYGTGGCTERRYMDTKDRRGRPSFLVTSTIVTIVDFDITSYIGALGDWF